MEQVVRRKHDRTEKANVFQKRLVWDYLYKEEFVGVMMILSEPTAVDKQKRMETDLFKVFQEFDEDKGGSIDAKELGEAMAKMGRPVSSEQLEMMIARADREGKGEVSFVDFAALFGIEASPIDYNTVDRNEQLNKLAEARAAFLAFDLDKSETIDVTELSAIMKTMGMKLSVEELDKMMKSVDEDGSGEIDFKEFCQLLGFEWSDDFDIDIKEIDASRESEKKKKSKPGVSGVETEDGRHVIQGSDAPNGTFLCGDPSGVTKVVMSPCGKFFGVCSVDEHVAVYEIVGSKSRKKASFKEHTHIVNSMAWSPDSSKFVSVGADKQMILWHVGRAEVVTKVKAHSSYIRDVAWAKDNSLIATASSDKTVKLWYPNTCQQRKVRADAPHSRPVLWAGFGHRCCAPCVQCQSFFESFATPSRSCLGTQTG